jgi:c-di-GMP-binding flagellar brake protein YcgR
MKERRRYVRLNISLEINYSIHGQTSIQRKSITKNISPGGARFEVEEQLPKGAILDIDIKIPTREEPITLKARNVWSKKESKLGKDVYDSGFEFIEIPEKDKQIFLQYLCNMMYDQFKAMG